MNAPLLRLLGAARLLAPAPPGGGAAEAAHDLPDAAPGYMLAVLGARDGWVGREELALLFWPDAAPEDAQRNLRVNLNRLRDRLLSWGVDDALASERRRLRWLPGSDLTQARQARSAGDWQAAAALCAGPFAPGLGFRGYPVLAEWADGQAREVLALSREAVLRCAATTAPARAAELAARHLAADPADEEVMAVRLQALGALGRHDELVREFEAFDARASAESGLRASPALAQLAARLGPGDSGSAPGAGPRDDSLVGRDEELAHALGALAPGRMLTLVGMGGVGKTRLARAVAASSPAVLWLPLADLPDIGELPYRLLRALGEPAVPVRDPAARAAEVLARRTPGLLVLDNAEQLLAPGAALATLLARWLDAVPALRLLITSREPLGHAAETVLRLGALPLPADDGSALSVASVQLLAAQARRAHPGFDPRAHRDSLARIARAVGGLPLALHLCAQWLRLLSPADVLAALGRDIGALDDAGGGLGPMLQRSWDRLEPGTQRALAALSVFVSPFSAADAAQADAASLAQLARLTELGLVEATPAAETGATTALQLHPLVRAFAAARLAADAAAERAARERHALAVARQLAPWLNWRTADQGAGLARIGTLLPEISTAWQWALAQGRADFIATQAPVLLNYFEKLGRWAEGQALFEAAEAGFDEQLRTDLAALAALWRGRALLLYRDGRFDAAAALAERGLAAARALDHGEGIKANLNTLALAHWMLGRLAQAEAAATEARDRAEAEGDRAGTAVFAGNLALLLKKQGRYADAEASLRQALSVHREVGNWSSACVTLNNLGDLLRLLQRADEAVAVLEEGLRLCDAYGFASSRPFTLINLARAHLAAAQPDAAASFALRALDEARRNGERALESGVLLVLAELALRGARRAEAAAHLAAALRGAHALNEPANLLEALCGYARWQLAGGRPEAAAPAVAAVLAHPRLHAELREAVRSGPLAALADGPSPDLVALVEEAGAALAQAAAGPG